MPHANPGRPDLDQLVERCRHADVLFVPADGYHDAPSRVRAFGFSRELNRRGWKTEVLSMTDDFTKPDGISHIPRNNWPLMDRYLFGRLLDAIAVIAETSKAVLYTQKADINYIAAGMAAVAGGNRLVFDYDDNDVEINFTAGPLAAMMDDFHPRRMMGDAAGKADACVASSTVLRDMLTAYNENTHLIRTVVDTQLFDIALRDKAEAPLPIPTDRVNIIWPGSIWNGAMMRDYLNIVRCFLDVPADVRQGACLNLLAFGSMAPMAAAMARELAEEAEAADQIRTHSFLEPDRMPALLAQMDIGLMFLMENKYTRAKSPTKMFEYMAMGLAVCASATGEPAHILEDGETGMLASDTAEFTDRLTTLIADAERRKTMARRGHETIRQEFCFDAIGPQVEAVLERLM